jgi:hypothetical protein
VAASRAEAASTVEAEAGEERRNTATTVTRRRMRDVVGPMVRAGAGGGEPVWRLESRAL